ncbi:AAA domain-containing protein [Niallia nealsonii]|nr:AAA domain-containing protein [Niallia nealsonii]
MMKASTYIKEWQKALQEEINHLKRYSNTKIALYNGKMLHTEENYTYYFETSSFTKIPIGSNIVIEWGSAKIDGRILSSDGKSLLVVLEKTIGETVSEAYLFHDPWELLEQLMARFDGIKESKRKRTRIQQLMNPETEPRHPIEGIKNHVHELALRCKYNPVTYVWGPPGTGKTYTLARVALQRYWKGKRILILSQSNQAVDVLLKEITETATQKDRFKMGDILRYGSNTTDGIFADDKITTTSLLEEKDQNLAQQKSALIEEKRLLKQDLAKSFSMRDSSELLKLEEKLAQVLEKIRKREIQFVKKAMIVGTTLAKAATDTTIYEDNFDLVIVDEASMCYVPQAAFAASLAKRTIICGDFKQLPPIAAGRTNLINKWLKDDIFSASHVAEKVTGSKLHPHLLLLNEQRRMHPSISSFTNKHIYHSLVGDHASVAKKRQKIASKAPFPQEANILLDTSGFGEYTTYEKGSKSKINVMQLLLSFQLMYEGIKNGMTSIGYVTPYRAQAELMSALAEELLPEQVAKGVLTIATVHRFQGSEKDMVIFDNVEGFPIERPGMLLVGKESERLINVAITRTKGKFIHVANRDYVKQTISRQKTIRKLMDHQEEGHLVILPKQIGAWIKHAFAYLHWSHGKKLDIIQADIKRARSSIVFVLTKGTHFSIEWITMLNERKKQVPVTIYGEKSPSKDYRFTNWEDSTFPMMIIDEKIVWLGHPLEGVKRIKPPSIAARVKSVSLAEYLLKQLPEK